MAKTIISILIIISVLFSNRSLLLLLLFSILSFHPYLHLFYNLPSLSFDFVLLLLQAGLYALAVAWGDLLHLRELCLHGSDLSVADWPHK